MKKIGMIGGMSWESTALYYKEINEAIKKELGSLHSARIILSSLDFKVIEELQHQNKWREMADILSEEALCLQNAKADFIIICTNTMHKLVPQIQKNINIPILHIADATAQNLQKNNIKKVLLLGTKFTMSEDFYKNILIHDYNIEVIVPKAEEQDIIHRIIYEELCQGIIKEDSRKQYLSIMKQIKEEHEINDVILGCTEITMLIQENDTEMALYDTTKIHALKAVQESLK